MTGACASHEIGKSCSNCETKIQIMQVIGEAPPMSGKNLHPIRIFGLPYPIFCETYRPVDSGDARTEDAGGGGIGRRSAACVYIRPDFHASG
jgi:hypothetical protein